jgi:hypothetical protein
LRHRPAGGRAGRGGHIAGLLEGGRQPVGVGQAGHGELEVDDVLGGQPGDRGGTDVVDSDDAIAELVSQRGRQLFDLIAPGRVVVHDDNGGHTQSVGPVETVTVPSRWSSSASPCRQGLSPNARQISLTLCRLIPCRWAIERVDQGCGVLGRGLRRLDTTASTTSSLIVRAAPGLGASTSPPASEPAPDDELPNLAIRRRINLTGR